ncbi:hypothetical protein TNCT_572901 [Trichonephila clavata]|uniref:Uncharacterized protein n=1 Tax=Trichonephila clavata TaxID=2740835 RepID=A0A8X6K4T7_TRICU|nr:hypothetical protein TNCT_572901 [Trichonephila clavata]
MSRRFPFPYGRNHINILISGASGCGATSLIESFISMCDEVLIHNEFYSDTVACQFRFFMDNHLYIIRTCDLSENPLTPPVDHPVPELHYRMDVIIYLYSIDDLDSLYHVMDLLEVKDEVGDLPCVLVGNKVDLRRTWEIMGRSNEGRNNFVSFKEAAIVAEEYNISWIVECSARTGQLIPDVLKAAVSSYLGKKGKRKRI